MVKERPPPLPVHLDHSTTALRAPEHKRAHAHTLVPATRAERVPATSVPTPHSTQNGRQNKPELRISESSPNNIIIYDIIYHY